MRYTKPHYYDAFHCIAGACPATCCTGWQIVIDEETIARYLGEAGAFGDRLRASIDWNEECFKQYDGRCAFLNEKNLCDLHQELGADALCDTCRLYPRHTEEYEGLRELSLSISCPEAARMVLTCEEPLRFLDEEDDEEDDFEEFDFLLFSQLEDARDVILSILQNREEDLKLRVAAVRALAEAFQDCLDEGCGYEIDSVLEQYRHAKKQHTLQKLAKPIAGADYENKKEELGFLMTLERLRDDWQEELDHLEQKLFSQGQAHYEALYAEFQQTYGFLSSHRMSWERMGEQLLVTLIYTYFCGAVYDEMVAAKMELSCFLVRWVGELSLLRWLEHDKKLEFSDVVEVTYRLAREIEHSDVNLNNAEEWLDARIYGEREEKDDEDQ